MPWTDQPTPTTLVAPRSRTVAVQATDIRAIPKALCVSIHDVAPATWADCRRLVRAVNEVAPVPLTLLVVPCYHGHPETPGSYLDWLRGRQGAGDELALHGFTHADDAPVHGARARLLRHWYTSGEGEFSALNADEARVRLDRGCEWFAEHGFTPRGFVAPAWLLSPGAWRALAGSPFLYTTTLRGFHVLSEKLTVPSQSLVYSVRSPGRRAASLVWNRFLHRRLQDNPLIRLSLHPKDAHHPGVLLQAQRFIESALKDRRQLTKAEFAHTLFARNNFS